MANAFLAPGCSVEIRLFRLCPHSDADGDMGGNLVAATAEKAAGEFYLIGSRYRLLHRPQI